jgi:uncharacterized membrane protein
MGYHPRYRVGDHHDPHAHRLGCLAHRPALSFVLSLPLPEEADRSRPRDIPVAELGSTPSPRFAALDAARGVALAAMVVFHCAFDLDSLGLAALDVGDSPGWRSFARLIASSFLALSGVSLVIAHGRGIRFEPYFRRLAILVGAAALVTLGTWYEMPRQFIFFGILHSIAVASLIGLAFLKAPWPVTLIAALLALAAPSLLASPGLDAPVLRWLGLGTTLPVTLDFEPVFPWLAPFLLGMAVAQLALPRFARGRLAGSRQRSALGRALAFAGRHSLAIYLIHQPVMFGTLSLLAQLLAGSAAVSAEDRPFIEACEATCLVRHGQKAACATYCSCTAGELKKAGLWPSVLSDRLTPAERERLPAAMQACSGVRPAGAPN